MLKNLTKTVGLVVLAASLGCKGLTAPNENDPSIEELTENPTAQAVIDATQGLMIGTRANFDGPADMVSSPGIVGRESYNLDEADPRWIDELLAGVPTGTGFGDFMWSNPYRNIRNANLILDAVGQIPADQLSDAEKEAIRGFAKTIQAYDFLMVINTRYDRGAPIDVGRPLDEPPAPIEPMGAVFDHIVTLLDAAQGHLNAASAEFPFELSSGFAGFDTPATFLPLNRALAARVHVYRGGEGIGTPVDEFTAALTALGNSFIDDGVTTVEGLNEGAYHVYGSQAGGNTNDLFQPSDDPNIRAHPSVEDSVEFQADGTTPDARFQRKIRDVDPRTFRGVGSDIGFDIYNSTSAPIPIIRNEELILLRAEANIGLGNFEDAEDDINLIRQVSGNLPTIDFDASTTTETALDRLLYEKKYSLLFEGGHHWIDLRRHDRLDDLPLDDPGHIRLESWPFPATELDARE